MKKVMIFLLLSLVAFKQPKPKLLKVEADAATWNEIINVIDLSAADPKERVAVKNFIIQQLSDTTKQK